jgi:outer membrane PBP1 activator LpoA protein
MACLIALVLTGCAAAPEPIEPPSPERAAAFAARGEHASAARDYEAIAGFAPTGVANDFKLLAAREWLAARDPRKAQTTLESITDPLDARQALSRDLSAAETALALGEPARGWSILEKVSPPSANADFDRYHSVRQRLAFATGRALAGISSSRAREARALDATARPALRQEFARQGWMARWHPP